MTQWFKYSLVEPVPCRGGCGQVVSGVLCSVPGTFWASEPQCMSALGSQGVRLQSAEWCCLWDWMGGIGVGCAQGCVVAWTLAELASPTVPDSGSSKYACLMRENRELKKHRKLKLEREQLKWIKNVQPYLAGKVKCLIRECTALWGTL